MRIRSWPKKRIRGYVPKTKEDFWKSLKQKLDKLKSLRSCFHTFAVRRTIDVLDLENQPGSGALGLTGDVWHHKYKNKKELKNYLKYSSNRLLNISFSLRCRASDPVFGQNRILIPEFQSQSFVCLSVFFHVSVCLSSFFVLCFYYSSSSFAHYVCLSLYYIYICLCCYPFLEQKIDLIFFSMFMLPRFVRKKYCTRTTIWTVISSPTRSKWRSI